MSVAVLLIVKYWRVSLHKIQIHESRESSIKETIRSSNFINRTLVLLVIDSKVLPMLPPVFKVCFHVVSETQRKLLPFVQPFEETEEAQKSVAICNGCLKVFDNIKHFYKLSENSREDSNP